MKELIKKLTSLATRYAEFGREINLPNTWNTIREAKDNEFVIRIYFADNSSIWSVDFGNIDISGYSNKITLPWNITEEQIEKVILDAESYMEIVCIDGLKKEAEGKRLAEIERLRKELAYLESKNE